MADSYLSAVFQHYGCGDVVVVGEMRDRIVHAYLRDGGDVSIHLPHCETIRNSSGSRMSLK
jgi:hypothetical protein